MKQQLRNAAILAIGSEMLGPTRLDTNSLKITVLLEDYGIELVRKSIVGDHLGDVAVFAIATADRLSIGNTGGPHRSGRTLGNALPAEGRSALGLSGIDLRDHCRNRLRRHVAGQLGLNAPGVYRRRSHPTCFVTATELDRKQHIGGLGTAIGSELGVGRVFEVRIFQIDVRISVAR